MILIHCTTNLYYIYIVFFKMVIEVQFLFFKKTTFSWALVLQHHQAQCHAFSTSLSFFKKKTLGNVSQLVGIC
jgi:hypothetical protein